MARPCFLWYNTPMPWITIDLDAINQLANLPLHVMMWRVFVGGGWVPAIVVLVWGARAYWHMLRREHYLDHRKYRLFAIDLPKENEQSPLAVENMIAHLTGTRSTNTFKEEWWEGKCPPVFSLEIVSIGGYIQFLIRTDTKYEDLVQAVLYAQYPDAELTEVEDYTRAPGVPRHFPDPVYSIFGSEFEQSKSKYLPIRTYPEFEHSMSQEFKDPMATMLEGMARLRPNEQLWFQLLFWPLKPKEWVPGADRTLKKMIGAKTPHKEGLLAKAGASPMKATETLFKYTIDAGKEEEKKRNREEENPFFSSVLYLSPAETETTKVLSKKMTKPGFEVKIRFIYLAPTKEFRSSAVLAIIRGYLGQFASLYSNWFGFAKGITTKRDYWFQTGRVFEYMTLGLYKSVVTRSNRIMNAYKARHPEWGWQPMLLNSEEIASLWHFPVVQVKAPGIKKIESRRGEAPFKLPVEAGSVMPKPIAHAMPPKAQAPTGLPLEEQPDLKGS